MQEKAFLPPSSGYSFQKSERLCSKKAFEFLFAKGKSQFSYPIKIIYVLDKEIGSSKVQVAFGVSKRNFKRAVKRNRVKRILREVYRKNKLSTVNDNNLYLMIMYVSKEIEFYNIIEEALIKSLNQIALKNEKSI